MLLYMRLFLRRNGSPVVLRSGPTWLLTSRASSFLTVPVPTKLGKPFASPFMTAFLDPATDPSFLRTNAQIVVKTLS